VGKRYRNNERKKEEKRKEGREDGTRGKRSKRRGGRERGLVRKGGVRRNGGKGSRNVAPALTPIHPPLYRLSRIRHLRQIWSPAIF